MRKRFTLVAVVALSLLGALTVACAPGPQASPTSPPAPSPTSQTTSPDLRVGDVAPDFTLPSADGRTVALAQYLGKTPVLLYFNMGTI